jgi:hypothetical protein
VASAAHPTEIDFADFAPVSLSARAFANATAFCIIRADCEQSDHARMHQISPAEILLGYATGAVHVSQVLHTFETPRLQTE